MSIVEIDITNACHKQCSNCTRFCGHHKKTFSMDFETFKKAVDSMDGFPGQTSLIGGEPLLHPQINQFLEYMQKRRDSKGIRDIPRDSRGKAIAKDYFAFATVRRWFELAYNKGRTYTLFTSIPKNYYKSYENIQETISNTWLNDHKKPSFHQPILVSYKDLGINDEDFAVLRDNCWLQNCWSASATPKGVFFCEVAGTLDNLFNGPGGHPIEPGWWKKDLSEYKDQFHWCDLCGMPLKTFSRNANESTDDASQTLYEKLKAVDSVKLKNHKINLLTASTIAKKEGSIGADMYDAKGMYLSDKDRLSDSAEYLRPNNIIRSIQEKTSDRDWILLLGEGTELPANFIEIIKTYYLNPGYLFICDFGQGRAALYSPVALAAQKVELDGLGIDELAKIWGDKVFTLETGFENIPDVNIPLWRNLVFDDFNKDEDFKNLLKTRIDSFGIKNGTILLPNVSSPFYTYSLYNLLEDMGHSVHILLSKKFIDFFGDCIPKDKLTVFEDAFYDFDSLKSVRVALKNKVHFDGFIMPFAFCASSVKVSDAYTDSLKVAEDIAGKSLGIVNIRRQFVEAEYDIWGEEG